MATLRTVRQWQVLKSRDVKDYFVEKFPFLLISNNNVFSIRKYLPGSNIIKVVDSYVEVKHLYGNSNSFEVQ